MGCSSVVRKTIARVLTVLTAQQRNALREFYKDKKYLPLDLRTKKTRAQVPRSLEKCTNSFRDEHYRRRIRIGLHWGLRSRLEHILRLSMLFVIDEMFQWQWLFCVHESDHVLECREKPLYFDLTWWRGGERTRQMKICWRRSSGKDPRAPSSLLLG